MKHNLDFPWNGYTPEPMAIIHTMREQARVYAEPKLIEQETNRLLNSLALIEKYMGKTVLMVEGATTWVDYRDSKIYCNNEGEVVVSSTLYDKTKGLTDESLHLTPDQVQKLFISEDAQIQKQNQSRFFGASSPSSPHVDKLNAIALVQNKIKTAEEWRKNILVNLENHGAFSGGFMPSNEFETIMLFSKIDRALGFSPIRLKINQYPDAIYESEDGDRLFVEFEYKSRNFYLHGHDVDKTDLVICWIHDQELPLPVIELQHAYDSKSISFDLTKISVK